MHFFEKFWQLLYAAIALLILVSLGLSHIINQKSANDLTNNRIIQDNYDTLLSRVMNIEASSVKLTYVAQMISLPNRENLHQTKKTFDTHFDLGLNQVDQIQIPAEDKVKLQKYLQLINREVHELYNEQLDTDQHQTINNVDYIGKFKHHKVTHLINSLTMIFTDLTSYIQFKKSTSNEIAEMKLLKNELQRYRLEWLVLIAIFLGLFLAIILHFRFRRTQIIQQKAFLKEKEMIKSRSDFVSNISHELRTPLSGVIGAIDLMRDTELDEEQMDYAMVIETAGQGLLGIINDLLDFSKIDSTKLHLEIVEFNLHDTILDTLKLLNFKLAASDIRILFDYSPQLSTHFMGDPTRIKQIINNLVGNAIKFTQKGHIEIRVSPSTLDKSELAIEVEDTGIGIPLNAIDKIFKSFEQVDSSTTRQYGGTGLGLSIVQKITDLFHGKLSVISTEKKGSIFSLTLPLKPVNIGKLPFKIAPTQNSNQTVLVHSSYTFELSKLQKFTFEAGHTPFPSSCVDSLLKSYKSVKPFKVILSLSFSEIQSEKMKTALQYMQIQSTPVTLIVHPENHALKSEYQLNMLYTPISNMTYLNIFKSIDHESRRIIESLLTPEQVKVNSLKKILIADDNALTRMIMRNLLSKAGFQIFEVNDGHQAISSIQNNHPDLVLMDFQMPRMTGHEATKAIRDDLNLTSLPIIGLSAKLISKDEMEHLKKQGFDGYISKPLKKEDFFREIIKHL